MEIKIDNLEEISVELKQQLEIPVDVVVYQEKDNAECEALYVLRDEGVVRYE